MVAVPQMSFAEKLKAGLSISVNYMPANIANEFKQLLSPQSLSIMVSVIGVWAASHAIGIGEVADIGLLGIGIFSIGITAVDAIRELDYFIDGCRTATSENQLGEASKHFARAVSLIGIQALLTLLTKGASRGAAAESRITQLEERVAIVQNKSVQETSLSTFVRNPFLSKLQVNDRLEVKGFITKASSIKNARSSTEVEQLLGFHEGYLRDGFAIVELDRPPRMNEFELGGYSQVASHHFVDPFPSDASALEIRMKNAIRAMEEDTLVKVVPLRGVSSYPTSSSTLDLDSIFPPGEGIPQWKLTTLIPGKVISVFRGASSGQ